MPMVEDDEVDLYPFLLYHIAAMRSVFRNYLAYIDDIDTGRKSTKTDILIYQSLEQAIHNIFSSLFLEHPVFDLML